MSIAKTINNWRWSWAFDRRKNDLGPTDDAAWNEYLDSLSISEVLWNLEIYDESDYE